MTDAERAALLARLRSHIGHHGKPEHARAPVNQPQIRQWCDAMEDHNPIYTSASVAARSVHGQIVAPPTMLVTWTIPGGVPRAADPADPLQSVLAHLRAAGYTGTVGTRTAHEYLRYLKLGDVLVAVQSVIDISGEKQTGLGAGHFVTTVTEYHTADGECVGRVKFSLLAYQSRAGKSAQAAAAGSERPRRPRPGISRDTRFFWDGVQAGELRIQRCQGCGRLHHPPLVRCPACGSYDLGYVVSCGKGIVYSFVEPFHPKVPAFDYPYVVGLVELEERTRLITNIVDIDPGMVAIGMPVEVVFQDPDPGLTLPMFRPRRPPRHETTRRCDEVTVGDLLPPCPIPITATLIIAGATASGDFTDFHHDRAAAITHGAPDIFMNLLTTGGLCGRYVGDWAGPEALLRSLTMRLGVPNHPHDTMTMSGSVLAKRTDNGRGVIEVGLRGYNHQGDHVTGTATLELPIAEPVR